jgi:hypothetical protein
VLEMKKAKLPAAGNVEPYNREQYAKAKKAMKSTEKSVKPVAKDTNKTRRKMEKPTKFGTKIPKPKSPVNCTRKGRC